jgi:hypothetical protein
MADEPITIDGHVRIITSSLLSALRSFREQEDAITLWVDALCINQEDLVEKMHQIGQMKQIYREAEQVVVWLGEHIEAEQLVVSLGDSTGDDRSVLRDYESFQRQFGPPDKRMDPVREQLERDWWRRIWVVQEVVAALNQPTVRCGATDTRWNEWHTLAIWLPRPSYRPFNTNFCSVVSRLREGHLLKYEQVCALVRDMQATEPRDKIFALLAFVDCELPEPMQADYSLPVSTVFCKFTMREICHKNNLRALRVRQSGRDAQGSSWAIGPYGVERSVLCYWVFSNLYDPDGPSEKLGPTKMLYSSPLRFATTTEELSPRVRWTEDCTGMFAKGAVVGHVEKCLFKLYGKTFDHPWQFHSCLKPVIGTWRRVFARIVGPDADGPMWRTMSAFFRFAQPLRLVFKPEERSGLGQYFYRTRTGKLVFGDPDFRPGDKICLLYGGGTDAFVLREYGNYHRLIGCAYVEGMKDSRFYQCLHDEKDIVEFAIR